MVAAVDNLSVLGHRDMPGPRQLPTAEKYITSSVTIITSFQLYLQ